MEMQGVAGGAKETQSGRDALPISYFLFPISYFLFPISYFLFPISDKPVRWQRFMWVLRKP